MTGALHWEAVGAVGELVSALAVVVSLLYLASQIRTQNREARMAAIHDMAAAFRESIDTIARPETAAILARASEDFDGLSDADRMVTNAAVQRIVRVWEEAFHQHREGRLDPRIWSVMNRQYTYTLRIVAFRRVWDSRKQLFDEEFVAFVDAALPAARARPPSE